MLCIGRPIIMLMCCSLQVLIQYTVLIIVQGRASESFDLCFNSSLEGFRLNTTVWMAISVFEKIDCVIECVQEPCCRSINYKKTSQNEKNCEMLHDVVYNTSEKVLETNSSYDHVYLTNPQKNYNVTCFPKVDDVKDKSCLDIKEKDFSHGDGIYPIDPDGENEGLPFEVKCDMTSFGGGWTMCYTTDSHVDIMTELTTTAALGYRADCNKIPFTGVIFVDEASKQKAVFSNNGTPVTFLGNYNKVADAYGFWSAQGVASTAYRYQMLICNSPFFKGLHFSGYTECYKQCHHWCDDISSPYFRTSAVSDLNFNGVAFNENGHRPKPKKLISVGIR